MEILSKMISPVLYGTNRSFKRQNTISLKTGVLFKVSEMRRLHKFYFFQPGKVLSSGTRRRVGKVNELNRPFSKMAAEDSNRSILKTYTSTRKSTSTLVTLQVSAFRV